MTEKVRNKPYSVSYLMKLEKAHPDVQCPFEVLDDGLNRQKAGRSTTPIPYHHDLKPGGNSLRDDKTVGFDLPKISALIKPIWKNAYLKVEEDLSRVLSTS